MLSFKKLAVGKAEPYGLKKQNQQTGDRGPVSAASCPVGGIFWQVEAPGQKVQAFEYKLEKIDDAVVDWHLLSLLSSKDDLINWAGVGKRTFLTYLKFFPTPVFFILNLTG